LVQAIIDAYWILESDYLHYDTIMNIRVGYFFLDVFGCLEEWFKFQTTFLSASLLKQEELPRPPSQVTRVGFICGGKFYRKLRQLLSKCTITDEVITWSGTVLGLKRAALPLRPDLIEASLAKHRSTLERQANVPSSASSDRSQRLLKEVFVNIEECVEEVFKQKASSLKERMPSPSSHWGWSRAEGGAVGRISELITEKHGPFAEHYQEFVGYYHTNWYTGRSPIKALYVPSYSFDLAGLLCQEALKEDLDCDVHIVLEPMKARIITSGPPLRYHVCRMIQKAVHGAMRKRPEYQLIGGPVTEEILEKNFSDLHSYQRNWVFVSADYSAATDNLNGYLSLEYCTRVGQAIGLDDETQTIFGESMTGHRLHYPEEFGGFVSEQNTGQLMGSPTSFPGLCLINLATLLTAWRAYCRLHYAETRTYTQTLRDLRPLVNGDDLLFVGPPDFVPVWRAYVEAVGLSPSPGKNYVSKDVAVINSTFFQCSLRMERIYDRRMPNGLRVPDFALNASFDRVHWVASGLLKGQARVLSDTRKSDDWSPEALLEENIDFGQLRSQLAWTLDWHPGCDEIKSRCIDVWFRYMRRILMAQKRSWRLPVGLGGLGLPFGGATRPQLVLANMIVKTSDVRLSQRSKPGRLDPKGITTYKQLLAENRILSEMGAQRVLVSELPYKLVHFPNPYKGVEEDPDADRETLAKICEMRQIDIAVSPYVVGLQAGEAANELREVRDFSYFLSDSIRRFRGGPCTVDEALKWAGTACWAGGVIEMPTPFFGRSSHECVERRRLSDLLEVFPLSGCSVENSPPSREETNFGW
jgi:hypothetical protein